MKDKPTKLQELCRDHHEGKQKLSHQ